MVLVCIATVLAWVSGNLPDLLSHGRSFRAGQQGLLQLNWLLKLISYVLLSSRAVKDRRRSIFGKEASICVHAYRDL
jgi:hypothetical protein